jgi:hypothetical protein
LRYGDFLSELLRVGVPAMPAMAAAVMSMVAGSRVTVPL